MKSKNGLMLLILTGIVLLMVTITIVVLSGVDSRKKQEFGRTFAKPTFGQIYLVTAYDNSDRFFPLVIAMPYKAPGDKKPSITDRRVLLKVKNHYLCRVGTWFITSNDGSENIISSPLVTTTNALTEGSFNQ
jgi:hypothetical protein